MTNSTRSKRPAKPSKNFPLFPHQNGYCAKKSRGRLHYFGRWRDDRKGRAAIRLWADQKDDLLAGRAPRVSEDALTIAGLCNHFCTAKERQRQSGDLTRRSFADYFSACKVIVASFGRTRLVDDLGAEDFDQLRAQVAKSYGVYRLAKTVQIVRSVFKYGYEAGLIDKPVRFRLLLKVPASDGCGSINSNRAPRTLRLSRSTS